MGRPFWVVLCGIGVGVSLSLGAQGVVRTSGGQTFEGDVREARDEVVIRKGNMETRIARGEIDNVRYLTTAVAEIKAELQALAPTDSAGRIALARRAFDARDYRLAQELAEQALFIDPNSVAATDLINISRRQIILERRKATTQSSMLPPDPTRFLDEQEINAVRQAELQVADENRVKLRFLNDVRKRFAVLPQNNAREFMMLRPFQQAVTIINEGDEQMRKDVLIADDPYSIREFRAFQRQLLVGCAAANCHGPNTGGGLILFNNAENEAATYTNFYLLSTFSKASPVEGEGVFAGSGTRHRMIQRQRPTQSLLLQYGLPISVAENPHPPVQGFRPLFQTRNDALYRKIELWIAETLRPVSVSYGIDYVHPKRRMEAATQPATDAAPSTNPSTRPAPVKPAKTP